MNCHLKLVRHTLEITTLSGDKFTGQRLSVSPEET